jgi:hypothetical protein
VGLDSEKPPEQESNQGNWSECLRKEGRLAMASEVMKLTAQIVMSHASMTELTPQQLIEEIKKIHGVLVSLESEIATPEPRPKMARPRKPRRVKMEISEEAKSVRDMAGAAVGDPDYLDFMEHREG